MKEVSRHTVSVEVATGSVSIYAPLMGGRPGVVTFSATSETSPENAREILDRFLDRILAVREETPESLRIEAGGNC